MQIPVTIDKSHIITIGERLYGESIELIRELVNNAYDADATRVDIQIEEEIALLSHPDTPRLAYQRQSKLIRDAFEADIEHRA